MSEAIAIPRGTFPAPAIRPDRSVAAPWRAITVPEAAAAAPGQEIMAGDTVRLRMGVEQRMLGKPKYLQEFPGLAPEGTLGFRAHRIGTAAFA